MVGEQVLVVDAETSCISIVEILINRCFAIDIMTSKEFRQKIRRLSERRKNERRKNSFPFGSEEWIALIQQEYLLWPKHDRRHQDRRSQPRRQLLRRRNRARSASSGQKKTLYGLLTKEEKEMLNELIQSDSTE